MLDRDLAELYETETKRLTESVKRNLKRFPKDFMFQLNREEWEYLRPQMDAVERGNSLRPQNATLKTGRGQHSKYLPYAFTEQGVAMLSGVLNSEVAINMNIAIMRAFVQIRKAIIQESDLREQLRQVKEILGSHDEQLKQTCLPAKAGLRCNGKLIG